MSAPSEYVPPCVTPYVNASLPNEMGVTEIPSHPDILNGTNCENPAVPDFKPLSEVDVLIVGGGPVGLMTACYLIRQGITFRILDQSPHPLIVGRADGLQPRVVEVLHQLGLVDEVTPLGPGINHTIVYKDGKQQIFVQSHHAHTDEGRYRGLHVVTQTEIEQMLIRDLIRHDILVERPLTVTSYTFDEEAGPEVTHPITANISTRGKENSDEIIKARFMVGCDGAHSMIRKSLPIEFKGITTDLHWGIIDAEFESNFPHKWVFGTVLNSEHGGCLIIPRERNMARLYIQLNPEPGKAFDKSKWDPESCMVQINKVFAPYYVKYAGPIDWYTILTINERVASSFTYKDRIFLAGDSCHVHSAKGAFGLNTGTMDAQNLAWKLGALVKGIAKPGLLSTYDFERRENAERAVRTSARYLRFVGNCTFRNIDGSDMNDIDEMKIQRAPGEDPHIAFFRQFAKENTRFLIGLDIDYHPNVLNVEVQGIKGVRAGYRPPDSRVALSRTHSGRISDSYGRPDQFTLLIFGSNLHQKILPAFEKLDKFLADKKSFYHKYAHVDLFQLVIVVRDTPTRAERGIKQFPFLSKNARIVLDDQLPPGIFGADAHSMYKIDHNEGGIVVVRPDMFVGTGVLIKDVEKLEGYFAGFLQ